MWISARYQPTALFSLRDSQATASGAKSLLFPSPYAVKMAILDIILRNYGIEKGKEVFTWLKGIPVALAGPEQVIVNNSFIKIAKLPKDKKKIVDTRGKFPFDRTVSFRQFVFYAGEVRVSFQMDDLTREQSDLLRWALSRINYFGKRGSFFQFKGFIENLSEDEVGVRPFTDDTQQFPRNAYMQVMDDMGEKLTFEKINITEDSKISERDREKELYLFPYSLVKSSKGYSLYRYNLR